MPAKPAPRRPTPATPCLTAAFIPHSCTQSLQLHPTLTGVLGHPGLQVGEQGAKEGHLHAEGGAPASWHHLLIRAAPAAKGRREGSSLKQGRDKETGHTSAGTVGCAGREFGIAQSGPTAGISGARLWVFSRVSVYSLGPAEARSEPHLPSAGPPSRSSSSSLCIQSSDSAASLSVSEASAACSSGGSTADSGGKASCSCSAWRLVRPGGCWSAGAASSCCCCCC